MPQQSITLVVWLAPCKIEIISVPVARAPNDNSPYRAALALLAPSSDATPEDIEELGRNNARPREK